MHFPSWLLTAVLPLLVQAVPPVKRATNPTVTISSGVVVGTASRVSNQPSVTGLANAYLGIPFARPPTSTLRFASPTPAEAWTTPRVAHTQPPVCLQQFPTGTVGDFERKIFNNPFYGPPAESEDCLYLNVFAPQDASPSNLKSVMFWLFGGNLEFGGASLAYYNGSSLAVNEDVVIVVPNYRTNIFGFSNSPQITFGQQNSGFLDQRFALQWVQDNIKAFGGDPTEVTIFGESAGGYSIKQLLNYPPKTPQGTIPFRAAIMESEATFLNQNGSQNYQQVLTQFNCAKASSPLACLQAVPATQIEAYISNSSLQFPPVSDKTYAGYNSLPQIQSHSFANVPILIGTNKNEAGIILDALEPNPNNASLVQNVYNYSGIDISSIESLLVNNYSSSIIGNAALLLTQILTDLDFTCPTSLLSNAIAGAGQQPVWRYRYNGVFPNLSPAPDVGAFHTVEIPSVWGTYPLTDYLGSATATQEALSAYMQSVWAGFAKNPSAGPGWPRLGSTFGGVELGDLGSSQNPTGEYTNPLASADLVCAILDPLLIAQGQAY